MHDLNYYKPHYMLQRMDTNLKRDSCTFLLGVNTPTLLGIFPLMGKWKCVSNPSIIYGLTYILLNNSA